MSGGHFDYDKYKIEQIADSIERVIAGNKKEVEDKDRWHEVWDDRIYYYDYPDEVIEKFKEGKLYYKLRSETIKWDSTKSKWTIKTRCQWKSTH